MSEETIYSSTIRTRMSASDAHYGGFLVNGARMLSLFGDVATELAILCDGDEGLLVGYENIEFLAPIYAGDFIEATGRITRIGQTSRRIEFEAYKVIAVRRDLNDSAADVLDEPVLVGRAVGTTVVKTAFQRKKRAEQA
ncbi:MAG TPA: hotdog domain-containing protein [Ktedonobacteraceae bacterium]|nr:hotdog domain-containing protein [Ktedonobacteraceae bacterium]